MVVMNELWYRIGISTSLLCVAHCLLTPVAVVFLPFLGASLLQGWFHALVIVIAVPVAVWALWTGYQVHQQTKMLWFAGLGFIAILLSVFIGHDHNVFEAGFMIAAGLLLSCAHFLNLRATHARKC